MPNIGPLEIIVVLLLVFSVWGMVLAAMKEQWIWLVLGILVLPLGLAGFVVRAKPGSAWARRQGLG